MHNDPMVVKLEIANFLVCNVLIDQGCSVDILYWSAFKQLDILESQIEPFSEQLTGFLEQTIDTMGHINLLTTFGDEKGSKAILIRYLLVNSLTSYHILIGWPALNELGAIISTPYMAMKFLTMSGKIIVTP